MPQDFAVPSLGPCRFDSPLTSRYFRDDDDAVLLDSTLGGCRHCDGESPPALEQAGPRRGLFFNPPETTAAIVTCGGLCPGLNDVIRALTMVLWYRYGVRKILGLRFGYQGLVPEYNHKPIDLTPRLVEDIHKDGGTVLGSSRGNQDVSTMVDFLADRGVDVLFAIGGDGTQRGALAIAREITARERPVAVVGVPKTIDNDISLTERTFGFETAVALSRHPIECAHMESKGVPNGVGLVKLMGRESGFVAAYATLASSDVNLVLIPEVPFEMEQVLQFLEKRMKQKSHAVVVAAEGAGQNLTPPDGRDASGNPKLGDVGRFLHDAITAHFASASQPVSVKYIDPSYTIRSSRAHADDSVFCFQLAENAVHAALSGRTEMVVGLWNGKFVHVPMREAVARKKRIDPDGPLWQSVLDNTGQPF